MKHPVLEATVRTGIGKSAARKARRDGKVPGILYGRGESPRAIEVDERQFERMLHHTLGEHGMIELNLKGTGTERRTVLLREVQHHPVTGQLLHADFYQIELGQKIVVSIPVLLVGQPAGVKKGGILEHVLRELEVECVARKMPENVTVDVSNLDIGGSVHVRDLVIDEDIRVLTDSERTVASVALPKLKEEVAPAAEAVVAEEAAEPEVVGKKEKEKEEKEEEPEQQEK